LKGGKETKFAREGRGGSEKEREDLAKTKGGVRAAML